MSLEEKIRGEIERLRALEEKAFGPRHGKYDFYDYLEEVWELYSKWKEANTAQTRAKRLASMYKFKLRQEHPPDTSDHRCLIQERCVGTKASGREPLNMRRETGLRLKRWVLESFLRATAAPLVVLAKGAKRRVGQKAEGSFKLGRRSSRRIARRRVASP